MTDTILNSLTDAVRAEASHWKAVSTSYSTAAAEISILFGKEDAAATIHSYFCEAQDATTDPTVWKRAIQGVRDSLKPLGFKVSATRDFRPNFRKKNPLFEVVEISADKAERKAEQDRKAEQAAQIEQTERDKRKTAHEQKQRETTAHDIADIVRQKVTDLQEQANNTVSYVDVITALLIDANIQDTVGFSMLISDLARTHGYVSEKVAVEREQAAAEQAVKKVASRKPAKRQPRKVATATAA